MAVKSGKPIEETSLTASTPAAVAVSASNESKEIYSLIFHDSAGAGATVDLTLGSERIEQVVLGSNETKEVRPVVVGSGKTLTAESTATGVVFHGAYTLRNGGDV